MTTLSLDISTSCTGWSVFNEDRLEQIGYISLSKHKSMYEKASHVKSELIKVVKEHSIDHIAVEENLQAFRPGLSSAKTLMTLAQFNGIVRWICYEEFNIQPIPINVNSARKLIGVKIDRKSSKKTKEQVLEWVAKDNPEIKWPTKILKSGPNKGTERKIDGCYDMADSYVIGKAYYILNK